MSEFNKQEHERQHIRLGVISPLTQHANRQKIIQASPFVSKYILLRRSEVFLCVLMLCLGIVFGAIALNAGTQAEISSRKIEFVSTSRAVSASLEARLKQAYATTDLIGFLASNPNNSTEEVLRNFHRHTERLAGLSSAVQRRWIVIIQAVLDSERAEFEAEMNQLRETWVPEWANREQDKGITLMLRNRTYVDAPYGQEYFPIIFRSPSVDRVHLWDPGNFHEVHPVWSEIDSSITTKCVAPQVGRANPEENFPAYVRCFARVSGPRSEIWFPSWALRVGYVLNEGLLSVVPRSVSALTYSMFDITGLTEEQYALEGLYTHASVFKQGAISVISPFKSAIAGQEKYTVQDARNNVDGDLYYENTVSYGDRVYLLISTGTKETLHGKTKFSQGFRYALIAFLPLAFVACFFAVFLVSRNKAHCDQELSLISSHTAIVGHICHAMRNPLHSIMFVAQVIHEAMDDLVATIGQAKDIKPTTTYFSGGNKGDTAELIGAVSVLDATAGSMYDLINSFMDFNQLNTCDISLNARVCDCINVAATVFAQHRIINKDHLDMTMVNEVGPCVMNLDLVRFRQVLSNGFGNSCKVTPSGYVDLYIRWTSPTHEAVDFIIEDSGPGLMGVDPEQLFAEYERGAQAKSVKNETASTGLGLTISRKIALAFGGSLHLEDRQAMDGVSGARFVFRLPADAIVVAQQNVAGVKASPPEIVATADGEMEISRTDSIDASTTISSIDITQVKIAFAEDDPANHAILKRMLKRIGCEVVGSFHDGQPMLEFLCEPDAVLPDVVLLDVVMGTLNGDAVMKKIRKTGCNVQCVALTGQSMPADLEHLIQCGFNAVLPKPYSTEELRLIIEERIRSSRMDK